MFESLDEAARGSVKRWEAPRIGRVSPPDAVLPAFGNAPRVAAGGGAASMAPSDARARGPDPEEGKGEHRSGGESAVGSGAPDDDTPAGSEARSSTSASSPPMERVDVGTSADDLALQRRFEEGRRQGWAEAQAARREAVIDESADLLTSLARARDARDSLLEEELLALARGMAKLIVRRELSEDAGTMAAMVREALERLPRLADAPIVHLHPVDASALSQALSRRAESGTADASGSADGPDGVSVVADETLARGDCRIESGASLIDAGVDAWLERIGVRHGSPGTTVDAADSDGGKSAEDARPSLSVSSGE